MKYKSEYYDKDAIQALATKIQALVDKPYKIMEVCGGQTHTIVKYGLDKLLPEEVTLVHGPGCPVCVTPIEVIDDAIMLSLTDNTILCSFGDMLKVPGSYSSLLQARSQGANIKIIVSPLDAVQVARDNPDKEVVLFAVGFETTAPANALAIRQAKENHLTNFSALISHVLVPPILEALLQQVDHGIDGFLAAGHVCTIMGLSAYAKLSATYQVPMIATGFEPLDILQGVYYCIQQLVTGRYDVENQYQRLVTTQGNLHAQDLLKAVFEVVDQNWRGLGEINRGGLQLKKSYQDFDARLRFSIETNTKAENSLCQSAEVLKGKIKPTACQAFGRGCTPDNPLGAPMVSEEGACRAYYRYRQQEQSVDDCIACS